MSLMKTLAKAAVGVAVAKGISGLAKSGKGQNGGLLGDILSGGAGGSDNYKRSRDSFGGSRGSASSGGGLGGLLEQLGGAGRSSTSASGGGISDLIKGLAGGGAAAGGLGGILGGMSGGQAQAQNRQQEESFGELLNDAFRNDGEPSVQPTADQEAAAGLMLRAMIQAAKADGKIDDAEKQRILGNLDDIGPEERDFINQEVQAPVDVDGLARQVPNGLEAQVYTMSVMAIDLDSRAEAEYLHKLASAMNLGKDDVNTIHEKLGVPSLYK
ncbi:tellurite resistance TerB family protein [Paracoccaceae bacterium GXU_MW_L88]